MSKEDQTQPTMKAIIRAKMGEYSKAKIETDSEESQMNVVADMENYLKGANEVLHAFSLPQDESQMTEAALRVVAADRENLESAYVLSNLLKD